MLASLCPVMRFTANKRTSGFFSARIMGFKMHASKGLLFIHNVKSTSALPPSGVSGSRCNLCSFYMEQLLCDHGVCLP